MGAVAMAGGVDTETTSSMIKSQKKLPEAKQPSSPYLLPPRYASHDRRIFSTYSLRAAGVEIRESGAGDVRRDAVQGPEPVNPAAAAAGYWCADAAADELPRLAAVQVGAEHYARRRVRGLPPDRRRAPSGGESGPGRRHRLRPLPRRPAPPCRGSRQPLSGRQRRLHGLTAAAADVPVAAADGGHGGPVPHRQLRRPGPRRRRWWRQRRPAPAEQLPRRVPQSSQHGQRIREYAESRHGRRRRRRVQERRRAAQGAAELLVAAGVGDVADLGDGERGAGWRQRGRRQRGRQQQRRARLRPRPRRHPRRVPHGRRLGGAPAAVRGPVRRNHHEAPQERRVAAVQPAGQRRQAVARDGGHREVPPVPGRRAVQDPRQARLRHPPPQHRRTGEEDEDQRADTEAAGARPQHGKANEHVRHVGSGCRLHQGAPDAGQGDERRADELHLLGEQAEALRRLTMDESSNGRCNAADAGRVEEASAPPDLHSVVAFLFRF